MKNKSGFTLIELVVCMVLLGICAVSVVSFIGMGSEFFGDTVARMELASYTRNVMLRMQRQIASSVPYQINIKSNKFIEFVQPIGTYRIVSAVDKQMTISVTKDQSDDIITNAKNACPNSSGISYEQKMAVINSNKTLKIMAIKKIENLQASNGIMVITLDDGTALDSLASNGNRAYIIDSCSYKRYYSDDSKNLTYECGSYNSSNQFINNTAICGGVLNSDKYKVQGLMFNLAKVNSSYQSPDTSNQNSILVGILTTSHGQSMSVSQIMEVGNAP